MKINLFDLATGGHHIGYASYLARYLVKQGDEVTFVTWKPDASLDLLTEKAPVSVEYVVKDSTVKFGGNGIRRFRQVARGFHYCFDLAAERRADIVHHLYLERSELPLYLQMTRFRKRPWNLFGTLFWPYFIHGTDEHVPLPKRFYHGANRWALGQLLRQGKLKGLFVHTNRIKEELVRLYGDDSLRQRIFVVSDPVEPLEEVPQEAARDRLGLPQGKPIILFFGGLRWDKGPDVLLEALTLLDGDWYAVIAGKPGRIGKTQVEQYQKRLRDPERLITRLGHIPDMDVGNYFAAADAVVLPYRKAFKGTSGILQRASVAGKPVIASDVGEVGPIVRENGLGIVVEPESPKALAKGMREFLVRKGELSKEMRPQALRYAEASDWRVMAQRVREAYLAALKE